MIRSKCALAHALERLDSVAGAIDHEPGVLQRLGDRRAERRFVLDHQHRRARGGVGAGDPVAAGCAGFSGPSPAGSSTKNDAPFAGLRLHA